MTHPDGAPSPYQPTPSDFVQDARDRWLFRRCMIFGSVALLGLLLIVLAINGHEGMFTATIWAFVALVTGYLGLPIADDFLQTRPGAAPRAA